MHTCFNTEFSQKTFNVSLLFIYLTFQVRTLLLMMRRGYTRKCEKDKILGKLMMTNVDKTFALTMMMR